MKPFIRHQGVVVSLPIDNVDTDQIIPSREMRRVSKTGLGTGLFADWRYRHKGSERLGDNPDFALNQACAAGASILLAGRNFGCGSSREHAVWALADYGFRAILAQSFGRIFRRNCARNNILAIELTENELQQLRKQAAIDLVLTIDLESQQIELGDGRRIAFQTEPFDRDMLLRGLDYIDFSLQYTEAIDGFIAIDRQRRAWAYSPLDASPSAQTD